MAQHSSQHDIPRPTGSARARPHVSAKTIERTVLGNLYNEVEGCFSRFIIKADDWLFDSANASDDYHEQVGFFEAMRVLRQHRAELQDAFASDLKSRIAATWSTSSRHKVRTRRTQPLKLNVDAMSLQSDAEVELSAAKSMLTSRSRSRFGRALDCLTLTLSSVYACEPPSESANPIGISLLGEMFCNAVAPLSLQNPVALSLLSLFEREVADHLGDIYGRALSRLHELGVAIREPAKDSPFRVQAATRLGTGSPRAGSVQFNELRRLLAPREQLSARAAAPSYGQPQATTDIPALMHSLGIAQTLYLDQLERGSSGDGSSYPSLEAFLLSQRGRDAGFPKAGPSEFDTLKLVSSLFEQVLKDPDVSLVCKALVARLQIPVLGVAIVDKAFFDDPDHPARSFLNSLAEGSIGWPQSPLLLSKHRLYRAAEALVQRINDEFPSTRESFQRAMDQWNELIARKSTQTEVADRRINQTVLGLARLNAARRIVERVINSAEGVGMPTVVISLIEKWWFQLMVLTCIKHGTDGPEWASAKTTYDDLVALCRSGGQQDVSEAGEEHVDDLMARLNTWFEVSGSMSSEVREQLKAADTALRAMLSPPGIGAEAAKPVELHAMKRIRIAEGEVHMGTQLADSRLSDLRPGSWIEVRRNPSSPPMRCRLVVIDDQSQTFVFANDDGLKVYERPANAMLEDLECGSVRLLGDEPVVDRAMEEMVQRLRLESDSTLH